MDIFGIFPFFLSIFLFFLSFNDKKKRKIFLVWLCQTTKNRKKEGKEENQILS